MTVPAIEFVEMMQRLSRVCYSDCIDVMDNILIIILYIMRHIDLSYV